MPTALHSRTGAALALAATAVAVAGCGSSASHHRGAPAARHSRLWLVRTSGAQPSVVQENRQPGTRSWRLPGSAAQIGGVAHGTVQGYPARETVAPGQLQRIYVSSPGARWVRVSLFRMGWYGGTGGREVLRSRRLPARHQPPCLHRSVTGLTECHWRPTLSFRIPTALPSGVYTAKLMAPTGASDCLFVVTASRPAPLLAQLSTATYEAYNAWGGDSLYPGGSDRVGVTGTTQGVAVSLQRPYDSITGAGQFFARDVAMVRFLERYGYPVSYTTSEGVDADPAQLSGHRALLDFGHSEYWSQRQADGFASARNHGTSLLFLSSDTLAWRVRFGPSSAVAGHPAEPDATIVAYKEHAGLDPDRTAPSGSFGSTAAALTGSQYLGCITARLPQPGPPTYRLYPWTPAPGLRPGWLFAGSGLTSGSQIPGIVGYELDAASPSAPVGTLEVGHGSATCMSPGAVEPGEPTPPPGPGQATSTLYRARSGALVFGSGTLSWELGLEPVPSASPQAPRAPERPVVAITRNLLARALR